MKAFVKQYLLLVLFAVGLFGLFAADMLASSRQFSEMENRYLAQRPKMTWRSLFENEYTLKYEEYINDQFIGRDGWITLKSMSESALLKIENNGIVYGTNGRQFEFYTALDEERLARNIGFVSRFVEQYGKETEITLAVIPNSYAVYPEAVPAGLHNVDQEKSIRDTYGAFANLPAHTLDLFPAMLDAKNEGNAYYNTDHHWTTLGAYHAYRAFAESRGIKPVSLGELEAYKKEQPGFLGTYFSKSKLFSAKEETITWYDLPFTSLTIDGAEKPTLHDNEKWALRDKHAAFLWGNNGVTVLKSGNNRNSAENETSRILVFKDSYGNSMVPFLSYHYDEVWMVDLRSIDKISPIMQETAFDDVLVMYNFMNFVSDTNLARLTY